RVPDALAERRRARHLARRRAEAHRLLGGAALRRGDYGTAQSQLLTATELNPRDADAWSTLGLLDLGTRRPREAVYAFERATELQPKNSSTRYNLSIAYIGTRQYEKATDMLKQVTSELPNDP